MPSAENKTHSSRDVFLAHSNQQTSRDEWVLFSADGKDYSGRYKRGYHLISNVWSVDSPAHGRALLQQLRLNLPETISQYVDYGTYARTFMVRVAGCSKIDENRPLLQDGQPIDTIPQWKVQLQSSLLYLPTEKRIEIEIPAQYESEINLSDEQYREALDLVMEKVSGFVFHRELSSIICLTRKEPSDCEICQRRHEHENAYAYVTSDYRVWFSCRRSPDGRLHLGTLSSLPSHLRDMVFPEDKEYDPEEIGIETGKSEIAFDAILCGDERPEQGASTTIAVVPKDLPSDLAKLLLFPGDELDDEFSA